MKKKDAWKTLSRKTILDHGKFLKVENHEVQLPDGEIIPNWAWIIIHDAALVLARREDGKFLLFRQTKYAIDGDSLAPVGGMLEPGEDPLDAAKRELLEEMGYESDNWVDLGSYVMDPNNHVNTIHLFLALDAVYTTTPDSDDLEEQELLIFSRDELERAFDAGEFKVLNWSLLIAKALRYLE